MSFVRIECFYFLPIVFAGWLLLRHNYAASLGWLLVASLVFYGFNQWWVISIIVSYCLIGWLVGLWLRRTAQRRLALAAGVGFNLLVLCFWKYTPLLVESAAAWLGWNAIPTSWIGSDNWVLPMGISFYAFTGIAYMVEVYRGTIAAETNLWRYSLFTSFFPHLVAGPILRPGEFLTHLAPGRMPTRPLNPGEGAFLIARGFFKKMVLADSIAMAIDPFFANISHPSTAGVWSLPYIYLYALQIYFDFSGYTDIARGLGLWFGFRWPENFNWPYFATSVQDFWRRWHMTLSRFLRDYLYIPLGGNRGGPLHVAGALMVTMLLGGLWHGASWSFMLWGGLHGGLLIVNRMWGSTALSAVLASLTGPAASVWRWLRIALTFHAVCAAWCFFRLTRLSDSSLCVCKGFDFDWDKALAGGSADLALWSLLAGYALATIAARSLTRRVPLPVAVASMEAQPFTCGLIWGGSAAMMMLAWLMAPGGQIQPFIYFRF